MILITGAAGFIGSVLVKELNLRGKKNLVLVDRLSSDEKWKNLRGKEFAEYIDANELFMELWSPVLSNLSAIYHIGACSSTTEKDMNFLMKNNVNFPKNIFNLATEKNIPILYASSAATYGNREKDFNDDHEHITTLRPLNPYGYSKQLFDEWVVKQKQKPTQWYGLKLFNVFGPNEYHKKDMSSIVHKAFTQIQADGEVRLFKSYRKDYQHGKQLRDFIYVKDCVRAMIELMKISDASGIYNMGTGQANSFDDLANYTFQALGKETKITYIDMPKNIQQQYQYFTQAKMDKFRKILPDFKFTNFKDAIRDYVNTYLVKDDPYY